MSLLLSLNKSYTKSHSAHVDYPDTNGTELTDGTISTGGTYGGTPGSLYANNLEVTIDLGNRYSLDYARFHYYIWVAGATESPTQVVMSASNDGVNFTTIATYARAGYWVNTDGSNTWTSPLSLGGGEFRYVRFSTTKTSSYECFSEFEVYGVPAGGGASVSISDENGVM